MRKKKYFQKLYNYNKENNAYLIEVSLDNYEEIYDDWDPSPFKKRDIESEFNDFVVNSSEDIPLEYNIEVVLYLPEIKKDEKKESYLISAYKNYYNYEAERINKQKCALRNKTISHLFFSFALLSLYFLWEVFSEDKGSFFMSFPLKEGIMIGGWVFLWEVFTNVFIKRKEIQTEYKRLKRLQETNIKFVYNNKG